MKYIAVLLVAGGIYMALVRPHGDAAGKAGASASQSATPGTDFLKEPLDRTHEVLDQAKERTKDPALQ